MENTQSPIVIIDDEALEHALEPLTTDEQGQARREALLTTVRYFTRIINLPDRGTGFPRWPMSRARLIDLVWNLYQLHCLRSAETGELLTMRRIAELLCEKLHRPMPKDPYHTAWACRRKGRTIIDHFVQILQHGFHLNALIDWSEPLQFPYFTSYRGVF